MALMSRKSVKNELLFVTQSDCMIFRSFETTIWWMNLETIDHFVFANQTNWF